MSYLRWYLLIYMPVLHMKTVIKRLKIAQKDLKPPTSRPMLPDFRKQHHIEHFAQLAEAAGAALETYELFNCDEVAKAP